MNDFFNKGSTTMRKHTFVIFLVLLLIAQQLYGQEEKELSQTKTLTVMSYNIWNGFDWGKAPDRKARVLKWIRTKNPDVVALQELNGYNQEKLLNDAKTWGHCYAEILKTSGYPVGITSNQPIQIKERILENMHHGALHCHTWGIDFMVVHLSPFSYKKRCEEVGIIQSRLSKLQTPQNRFIILGDFNALSPIDADLYQGNEALLESKRESEKQHQHVRNLSHGEFEYGVISSFLSIPSIDVVQKHTSGLDQRISCPTQVFENEPGKGRHPNSVRIDYILASPSLAKQCTNAKVENRDDTLYLSDHYPVVAEFRY